MDGNNLFDVDVFLFNFLFICRTYMCLWRNAKLNMLSFVFYAFTCVHNVIIIVLLGLRFIVLLRATIWLW